MEELMSIVQKFVASGWDLIDVKYTESWGP